IDSQIHHRVRLAVHDEEPAGCLAVRLTSGRLARLERPQQPLPQRKVAALPKGLEHRVGDLRADDGVRRDDDVPVGAMSGPRPVARARSCRREPCCVETSELAPLDELVAGRDLVQHARRRVAGAQQIETEMTEARIGARLRDDGSDPGRHVNAAGADGHLARRNRDAEHAGALAAADQRERRELDPDHRSLLTWCERSIVAGTMTNTAEVLIVGAGIMGVSTAYHLARLGVRRVVVLERDTVCSGSTALASGGIRHQYANRLGVELTTHSIVTYERFAEEFGVDPHFRQHGYLILVATDEELATARRSVALQRSLGVAVELLDPALTHKLCPYLNTDDLLGATYTPPDGYADPYLCATAIAARARDLGVVIRQQHEVRGFVRDGDRVRGVTTAAETFEADAVVIATGAWSGVVGRLAGVDI